jgi:hypothetical protein
MKQGSWMTPGAGRQGRKRAFPYWQVGGCIAYAVAVLLFGMREMICGAGSQGQEMASQYIPVRVV